MADPDGIPEDPGDMQEDPEDAQENPNTHDESSVSSYLSDHPGFVRRWFLQHASLDLVSEWLAGQSLSDSRGRNSVTTELFRDMVACPRKKANSGTSSRSRGDLQHLKEADLLMELIRDIANELDVDTLCHKILVNLTLLTGSDRGSLFLAKGPRHGGQRYLVAKLFDVTPSSALREALEAAEIPPIPFGVGIVGHVALTKESVMIEDAYQDSRFNREMDARTGYRTVSVMCQPVLNFQGDVIGVAQCINKVGGNRQFTYQDQEVFRKYLTFCGIGVQNAQLFEMSVREFRRNQLLLGLARSIFEESSSLDRLIGRIMGRAQELLRCHTCRVYLIDQQPQEGFHLRLESGEEKLLPASETKVFAHQDIAFATIFELRGDERDIRTPSLEDLSRSEAAHVHFARHVVATEQTFNWSSTDSEVRNSKECSLAPTLPNDIPPEQLRSQVLSIPIFDSDRRVIGVAQMVDKLGGRQPFTDCDISTLEAFSIFCGLGIHNTQMYESAQKLMAKQRVALEVLSYHASSSLGETRRLAQSPIPSAEKFGLHNFGFNDFGLTEEDTCQAAVRMFLDLNLVRKFRMPYQVLCRWVLSVKKNYRPVIYHNWRHALNVTQTIFAMLLTGRMRELMSDLEVLALMVACLCHDLDHRGTNNSFQTKIDSPLAILYSTSTMEHHHFDQCVMILNSEGNTIFQSLSPSEYRSVISIVESAILSTDLALYFKKKEPFLQLLSSGRPDWWDPQNKALLRGMMMTACDVSAICKPWEVQRRVAELVAGEFFQQGDLEKEKLKEQPIAMMDRERRDELPAMQVGFIDCVCLPVYQALTAVQPALSPLLDGCRQNRKNWQSLTDRISHRAMAGVAREKADSYPLNGFPSLQQALDPSPSEAGELLKRKISSEQLRRKRGHDLCTVL